jgi:hypothetical protein
MDDSNKLYPDSPTPPAEPTPPVTQESAPTPPAADEFILLRGDDGTSAGVQLIAPLDEGWLGRLAEQGIDAGEVGAVVEAILSQNPDLAKKLGSSAGLEAFARQEIARHQKATEAEVADDGSEEDEPGQKKTSKASAGKSTSKSKAAAEPEPEQAAPKPASDSKLMEGLLKGIDLEGIGGGKEADTKGGSLATPFQDLLKEPGESKGAPDMGFYRRMSQELSPKGKK